MPTNYTGDSTATQAPSGAPEPEGAPIVALPADGDPPNASAFAQAYKALADWVAFALKPKALASDWDGLIQVWRSGANKKRWGIDHLGFPAGKVVHLREPILSELDIIANAATADIAGMSGWKSRVHSTSGSPSINALDPSTDFPGGRRVKLVPGGTLGDYSEIGTLPIFRFDTNVSAAFEFDMKLNSTSGTGSDLALGLVAGLDFAIGDLPNGIWFGRGVGPNLLLYPGGSDSGVAVDTSWHRYRVEWHGQATDDANVARALFFIDGVLVGNITAGLPTATDMAGVLLHVENIGVGTALQPVFGAPLTLSSNTWLDAF